MEDYIIFKYRLGNAACCQYGQYEGFQIEIKSDNTLVHTEYEIQNIEIEREIIKLDKEDVKIIKNIISKSNIEEVPKILDNGSCDGDLNYFLFSKDNRKYEISAWNIYDGVYDKSKEEGIEDEKYKINYFYECAVTRIFNDICSVLKKYNLKCTLYNFKKERKY